MVFGDLSPTAILKVVHKIHYHRNFFASGLVLIMTSYIVSSDKHGCLPISVHKNVKELIRIGRNWSFDLYHKR
ncbi:hypothetical protein U14_01271 [Candidatus Moduliflexus flocculans]|uniref:Uncharacterized protein n=1 Tax=Candidatus Moduliflexus flocculans TaxID=1499966 RepID=A0A0S6VYL9_9BACT|nr:hypothetical protein U14_01271 [Candidatus Moduliflexus flocculans]